jgi:hypothetical protein
MLPRMNNPAFEDILSSPERFFPNPEKLLDDDRLSREQKREVLERWEAQAIHMQESDGEGFGGGERSHLDDIKRALDQL